MKTLFWRKMLPGTKDTGPSHEQWVIVQGWHMRGQYLTLCQLWNRQKVFHKHLKLQKLKALGFLRQHSRNLPPPSLTRIVFPCDLMLVNGERPWENVQVHLRRHLLIWRSLSPLMRISPWNYKYGDTSWSVTPLRKPSTMIQLLMMLINERRHFKQKRFQDIACTHSIML